MYARAYINFKNQEDIILFRDRFDGYVFLDNKGESLSLKGSFFVICMFKTMCVSQCFLNAFIAFLKFWVIKCATFEEFYTFAELTAVL